MKSMYIGSGDISSLLCGFETEAYKKLLQRFVSDQKPIYNAKASPIPALRTGAILEDRYLLTLPFGYFPQFEVVSKEMDVLKATLDNALMNADKIVDFDELKSLNFEAFLLLQNYKDLPYSKYISFIKKTYKKYYNQIQEQLYCTELDSANLSFLSVYSYDDEINYNRIIEPNDIIKFRIKRDEEVISLIKERASIFQQIKNYYVSK